MENKLEKKKKKLGDLYYKFKNSKFLHFHVTLSDFHHLEISAEISLSNHFNLQGSSVPDVEKKGSDCILVLTIG